MQGPISIVIPTYNRVSTLGRVIDSYLVQKKVGEIIIVDDGSTDSTPEMVSGLAKRSPEVKYVRHESHLGLPATRNTGIWRARGDYVLFGEDDLRFSPDYAETLLACLEKRGGDIVAGRIVYPLPEESDADAIARLSVQPPERLDRKRLMFDTSSPAPDDIEAPFVHACSLMRRDTARAVLYDEGYRGSAYREETDFYVRSAQMGSKIYYCPHTVCFHLPREVKKLGGCMSDGIWAHKYWGLVNNYRFLRKNHAYLRKMDLVRHGRFTLMFFYALNELPKLLTFYLRKHSPRAYAAFSRRIVKARL